MNPTVPRPLARLLAVTATVLALVGAPVGLSARAADAAPADAPGGPGAAATWTTGDKEGLGTSTDHRLEGLVHPHRRDDERGLLPERGHPERAGTAVRGHGRGAFTQRETDATVDRTSTLSDRTSLTYQQISTDSRVAGG